MKECEAVAEFTVNCEKKKGFAYTAKEEAEINERQAKFHQMLEQTNRQVKQLATKFRQFTLIYLGLLASSPDLNLQLLSVRLNFNDYYHIAWQPPTVRESTLGVNSIAEEEINLPESKESCQRALVSSSSLNVSLPFEKMSETTSFLLVSPDYGSVDSLLGTTANAKRKKHKQIWCCVGWRVPREALQGICVKFIIKFAYEIYVLLYWILEYRAD